MTEQETPRYSDGSLMPVPVGAPITAEHLEIVRKYLGPPGPGEVATAAMVNRALELDRSGALTYDEIATAPVQDLDPPTAAADIAARRQAGGTWRPAEGPVEWNDPGPAERLQDTVRDVRARRTAGITVPVRVDPDPQMLRITALHAAAQVYAGKGGSWGTDTVLEAADDYAAWLATGERPDRFPVEQPGPADPALTVAGYTFTFEQLRNLGTDAADRLARNLDAALAEDRVDHDQRPLVRTALAILRRQR